MPDHNELDGYSGPEAEETNRYLRERHGDGYLGFQRFRLVHSAYLSEFSAGHWDDWDPNLPVELRGQIVAGERVQEGQQRQLTTEHKSDRRITEMRRIPKYCEFQDCNGWVFEVWMGPAYFGSPSWWAAQVVPGTSLPQLGPYPHRGGYVSAVPAGLRPWPEAPTGPFLDRVVEQWEMMRDETLAYEPGAFVRLRDYEARERDKMTSLKWNRDAEQANMTALRPFFSTTLDGGKARQLAAEHAGLTSNYGN
jgi:hypothetical protein